MTTRFFLTWASIGLTFGALACGRPSKVAPTMASAASASTATKPAAAAPRPELPKTLDPVALDAWIAHEVKTRGIVGAAVVVVDRGNVVLAKGYGKKSIATPGEVTPDTSFRIGSVTKQITCAAALALSERGKLSLDDKISKYFPDATRAKDITLDDTLAHTAGYPDYYPLDFVDSRMTKPTTGDTIVQKYASKPLDFDPRTRWSYSNTGFVIVGRAIEKASGASLAEFVEKVIFRPAGMNNASYDPKTLKDVATGHTSFALGPPEVSPPESANWLFGAGDIYASARDLAAWDVALMDKKLLNAASLTKMFTPRTLADGTPTGYACGLAVGHRANETILAHSGAVSGFASYNAFVPRTRSAVVLLANGDFGSPGSIHTDLMNLLVNERTPRKPPTVEGPPAKEAASELFRQMQKGALDRAALEVEFAAFMNEGRIRANAPRLLAMGEVKNVELLGLSERGGAEVASLMFVFEATKFRASLFRGPDGKIQQFLLSRP